MKLIKDRAASHDHTVQAGLNRLAGHTGTDVLGAYVVVGKWCWSLVWCRPACKGKH